MRRWLLLITILTAGRIQALYGQMTVPPVSYTVAGSTYTQNFDGLPSTGSYTLTGKGPFNFMATSFTITSLAGWQMFMWAGSNANAGFVIGTGSATNSGVYSVGAAASTDRALGSLSSGTGIYSIGLVLTNHTGGTLNYFTVNFTAEQWRKGGSGNKNTWSCRYKTGNLTHIDQPNLLDEPNLNFSSVHTTTGATALVGNLPENQQMVSYTVQGINWKAGEQLLIRWDDADEAGNDDIMAIDNFSFSAGLTAGAPTITAAGSTHVTTNTAELSGTVSDNFSTTVVVFEYDTVSLFTNPGILRPDPDTIQTGGGNTNIAARLSSLLPGKTYFYRISARNNAGEVKSAANSFTTAFVLPVVTTMGVSSVLTSTASIAANVTSFDGDVLFEKGFVWSLTNNPSTATNKINAGAGSGYFSQLLINLPQGTVVFVRAYAINGGGTAYGDTIRLVTQTLITASLPATVVKTNAAVVSFVFKTAQAVAGLSAANFSISATGISGAFITSVTGTANNFTITVNTGTGSGSLELTLANDAGLSVPLNNKPYSNKGYTIDKLAPQFKKAGIPDAPMKIGDTVPVTITVSPDPDLFKMTSGNINGYPLSPLLKKNDSTYTSSFIVTAGGNDVDAAADIPLAITLVDSAGNVGTFTSVISQSNDGIDATKPLVLSIQNPPKGIYKSGDTLHFTLRFTEKIIVSGTGVPSISLVIGTRTRTALYTTGSHTDSLLFRYIIVADDFDDDGIKTATVVTLNSAFIKDIAGNTAVLNFTNALQPYDILIDAVIPVVNAVQVPSNKTYRAGDTLQFIFGFSKGIILQLKNDMPIVKITIGTAEKELVYRKQSSFNTLVFSYVVQYGDLDKKGISIGSSIILNNAKLTDSAGNTAAIGFKTASLANIKIDAVAPVFTIGISETVYVCENTASITIGNAFAVTDDEVGELVSWRIKSTVQRGTISLAVFSATSTGKNIIPSGIVYKPYPHQNGTDTLVTELTDGVNTTQKSIVIFIQPIAQNNSIGQNQLNCEEKTPAVLNGSIPSGGNGLYKYAWDFSIDSLRFYAAPGLNEQENYAPPVLHTNTWFRRRVSSGVCADTSATVKITIAKNGFWTGNKNNDWSNTSNWCNGLLPGKNTNVFIYPEAAYQPLVKDTASCNDLFLSPGAHLSITGILEITGNINAAPASVQAGTATLVCNGTSLQNIDGGSLENNGLHNMTVNNPAGIFLSGDVKLTGTLLLHKGWLQTNEHLLLKQDAAIGSSANGTRINGTVAVEHFINGGRKAFHLLGHPFVDSVALQQVCDSIDITGENGLLNGFTATPANQPSAFFHNYNLGNDSTGIDAGWISFTNTNGVGENAWRKYTGIRLLFNGSPGQGLDGTPPGNGRNGTYLPQPVVLKLRGTVNTGDQEINLARGAYPGYHVVANPYACNIDVSRITKSAGIGNYYWIWDPQQGKQGGYTSIPFTNTYNLPKLGAFVVKANDKTSNLLLFTEHCKTKNKSDLLPVYQSDDIFFIELRLETDGIFWDRWLLLQMDNARAGIDNNDAEKLINPDVNFYSLSRENKKLSADARPVTNETVIPIGLQANENESFRIKIAKAKLPSSNTLMLHDKFLNRWMPLETDSTYPFTTTHDTASTGDKRFEIASPEKPADSFLSRKKLTMKTYPVPAKNTIVVKYASTETAKTDIRIVDLSGNLVKNIPLGMQKQGQVIIPIGNLVSGVYIVEIRCGNEVSMQKIIKD